MTINLMQTAVDPEDSTDPQNDPEQIKAALQDMQGNILKSHGRDHSRHLFVQFGEDAEAARAWVRTMGASYVTSAWKQFQDAKAMRLRGTDGGLFVNLALSSAGYRALGLADSMPSDKSFVDGAKASQKKLNDPPVDKWEPGFQKELHALVIVADDDHAALEAAEKSVRKSLEGAGAVVIVEKGAAMRVDAEGKVTDDKSSEVHEHFGFADGISQPLFYASDIERSRRNSGGFDRYDPSAPLGLVLLKDPGGSADGFGSYFVYRKLQQDVAGFRGDVHKLAETLAKETGDGKPTDADRELAGAYTVGRFRDGTPVVEQAVDGWTNEPNNFSYYHDVDGVKCPFHAHARKTNPRGDKGQQFGVPPTQERARRIARRAISYGPLTLDPPPNEPVGLLFLCAQSSIVDQFEFMQATWSNFDDFLRYDTGIDTLIGQAPDADPTVPQRWPRSYGSYNQLSFASGEPEEVDPYVDYQFSEWVEMRGGEYFFVPSLSFLSDV